MPSPSSQLSKISIQPSDVFNALSSLDADKAVGIDNISPKLLKFCAASLTDPITKLFSLCLETSSFPDERKIHKIRPLYKKGDRSLVENYRPISLLCIISKLFESIIYDKIFSFVGPLISSQQFRFLPNRSCISQLLIYFSQIYHCADHHVTSDVVFVDFKKAFDSVPHQELLFKLWKIGITGPLWLLFCNYLSNRYHFVSFNGASSERLPVLSGVPHAGKCTGSLAIFNLHQ